MTREEAVKELKIIREDYWDEYNDPMPALDMAIKALEQQSEDAISRQAAIDIVQYECGEWKGLAKEIVKQFNGLPSIQPKQIECEDAISREDALKALAYDIESFEFKSGVSRHMNEIANLLNTIYEIQSDNIKALPSVQPKTGHWISYWDEEARCYVYKCPECGNKQPFDTKHCWECGARLDAPDKNDGKLSEISTGSESEET